MRWSIRLAVLLAFALQARSALTTVTGTIQAPDGTPATGRAYIDLSGPCVGGGGVIVVNTTKIVSFIAGVFTVDLEPTSTCVSTQVYRVRYQMGGFNTVVEFWNVSPASPTTIAAVRVPSIPVSTGSMPIGVITGLACKGDIIAYTGTTATRVPCGTNGYVLKRDDSASNGVSWQVATAGATYGRYSTTVSSSSTWTVLGTTHGLGTCALATQFWVSDLSVDANTIACNSTTFDVTVTWSSAQTGDIYITSDPVFVADNLLNGSLISQIAAQTISGSPITITHSFNAVVILRCYDASGNRLYYDVGTRLSANALTVSFVGAPAGFCVAGR